ncbi:MAG TPA: TonB family protein [Steroidobacteraceae bacterium]
MHSRRPDPSFIAPAAGITLSADPVDVVALTTDEALLTTLREAMGPQHALWHAQSADATVELLVGGHCGILIIDLQVVHTDAARLMERLQAQFPELVLLATGRREEESAVASLVSSGRVYRFLHKPVSPARASLFISAGTRRYIENNDSTSPTLTAVRQFTQPSRRTGTIVAAIGALIAALLAWMYWPHNTRTAPESTNANPGTEAAARTAAAVDRSSIPEHLAAAQQAFAAGHLSSPPGDNALDHYRAVLAKDAGNKDAAAGVAQVIGNLETQVKAALAIPDLPKAAAALTALQHAQPGDPQLDSLRAELLTLSRSARPEISALLLNKAQPLPARQAEPAAVKAPSNLAAARARIAGGQLTDPEDDNAAFFLRRARAANENESATSIVATDLGNRLLEQTRQAIATGNAEAAQRALAVITNVDHEFELTLPDLDAVRQQAEGMISDNRKSAIAEQLARAIKSRESGRLIAPAGNNAYEQLSALVTSDPRVLEVRTEQQRLAFTLLENTRTALAGGDLDSAEALAKHADSLVPDMTNTRTLLQQIAAIRQERILANTPVPAATLKRTREVPYVYPRDAQRDGIEGWVDIDFTIAPDGSTQDLAVRASAPQDTFDKAALDALRKWRFEPVQRNGAAVAQRATVRVRFSLK